MGNAGMGALQGLSNVISQRLMESHARKEAAKEQERQTEYKAWEGILLNPSSTPDERQRAQDAIKKLVPKESVPLVEGYHKVVDAIHRRRQGQAPAQAPPQPPSQVQPAATNPSASAPASQARPEAPGLPQTLADVDKRAPELAGTQAGQQQVAMEKIVRQDRMQSVDAAQKWYQSRGQQMPEGEQRAMQLWALTGHFPPAAFGRTKMHPVTITDDNGDLIPAMEIAEGEDAGKVIANGQIVDNPHIAPKWKPVRGWAKDDKGKFFSFAIDPATNQPIKGTEDYSALPPSQYLEHYKEGMYYWTDDSGNVHATPNPTRTGVVTSGSGTPMGKGTPNPNAPAVPSSMRGPGKKSAGSSSTSTPKSKSGDRVIGTKDTGVLNPAAQKVLTTTQPVLDQVDRLMADIDKLGLQDNNDSGYLFTSMMKYKLGKASPDGSLGNDIAGLSLGSVVEAASALGGTSRSLQALKKALVHTPNPWVDSPKLMREKLQTIKDRLSDIVKDANELGRKRQTSTAGPASAQVPGNLRGPQKQLSPDEEAEQYLSK